MTNKLIRISLLASALSNAYKFEVTGVEKCGCSETGPIMSYFAECVEDAIRDGKCRVPNYTAVITHDSKFEHCTEAYEGRVLILNPKASMQLLSGVVVKGMVNPARGSVIPGLCDIESIHFGSVPHDYAVSDGHRTKPKCEKFTAQKTLLFTNNFLGGVSPKMARYVGAPMSLEFQETIDSTEGNAILVNAPRCVFDRDYTPSVRQVYDFATRRMEWSFAQMRF